MAILAKLKPSEFKLLAHAKAPPSYVRDGASRRLVELRGIEPLTLRLPGKFAFLSRAGSHPLTCTQGLAGATQLGRSEGRAVTVRRHSAPANGLPNSTNRAQAHGTNSFARRPGRADAAAADQGFEAPSGTRKSPRS